MSLCSFGHLVRTAELLQRGWSRRGIAALRDDPDVMPVSRGLFACAHLDGSQRTAVTARARIDCISRLRQLGVWAGHGRDLHLRMPLHASHSASATLHWTPLRRLPNPIEVDVFDALYQGMRCLPPDDVVAAMESAVHLKLVTQRDVAELLRAAPREAKASLELMQHGAQSGVETHVRLRLVRAGYRVMPQVFVPGVGHIDNLVEDCVDVETDGRAYHVESFDADRARDVAAEYFGIRVLRVAPAMVFGDWPSVRAAVDRMVADALRARSRPRRGQNRH